MAGETSKRKQSSEILGPAARVARAATDTQETNTILLFPVPLEYLIVQVTFHKRPAVGLALKLRGADGAELGSGLVTDARGKVALPRRVAPGTYQCEIEHQATLEVCTVASANEAFAVVLPVGRAYADDHERLELPSARAASKTSR